MFVQVTFVPTATVRLCGLKAKLAMVMLFPPVVGAVVGVATVVGALVGVAVGATIGALVGVLAVDVPPHAAVINRRPATNRQNPTFLIEVAKDFCIVYPL